MGFKEAMRETGEMWKAVGRDLKDPQSWQAAGKEFQNLARRAWEYAKKDREGPSGEDR